MTFQGAPSGFFQYRSEWFLTLRQIAYASWINFEAGYMNILRQGFKNAAENYSKNFEEHLGDLLNKTWEVVRVSSHVIDNCLGVRSICKNKKHFNLLMMSRNLLSDCCCCLDALVRGPDRTIKNNLRMILEDLCCIIDASENEKVYDALQKGEHQASQSISFAIRQYPKMEIGRLYGRLSKTSHHMIPGFSVRQLVDQKKLIISHLKPFDFNQCQVQLDMLTMVILFAGLVGEVAEKFCVDELKTPYFWTKQKNRLPAPIYTVICEMLEKIKEKIEECDRRYPQD